MGCVKGVSGRWFCDGFVSHSLCLPWITACHCTAYANRHAHDYAYCRWSGIGCDEGTRLWGTLLCKLLAFTRATIQGPTATVCCVVCWCLYCEYTARSRATEQNGVELWMVCVYGDLTEWGGIVGDRSRLPTRKRSVTKCAARWAKAASSARRYSIAPRFEKMAPNNRDLRCVLHRILPRGCFGQNTSRIQDNKG